MRRNLHQSLLATKKVSAPVADSWAYSGWLNLAQLLTISIQVSANEKMIVANLWTRVVGQEERKMICAEI